MADYRADFLIKLEKRAEEEARREAEKGQKPPESLITWIFGNGFIPFRFQGQYEDEETGLYYNRFRFYSPEEGCYTQQDPIGLAGGNPTLYGYVSDTNSELDLLGLSKVWRNLRPDETISDGISDKLLGRDMSPAGHIMNGGRQ